MDTASFNTDSPNINVYNNLSTFNSFLPKTDNVPTGSTADINDANNKHSKGLPLLYNGKIFINDNKNKPNEIINVDIIVPIIANIRIVIIFSMKCFCFNENPASNTIGGNNT